MSASQPTPSSYFSPTVIGVLCGLGAAFGWAAGFVAARHAIKIGFAPADLAFHRFAWAGLIFLPGALRLGFGDLAGVGWPRGLTMALLAGPLLAVASYVGFLLVPLGHGAVIQPAMAATGGLVLAWLLLGEPLLAKRIIGAGAIICGLVLLVYESLAHAGGIAVLGDLSFVAAGLSWALFGTLVRKWNIEPARATMIVCVLALLFYTPIYFAIYRDHIVQFGLWENALQIFVQGVLAGPGAIHLYSRAVVYLGASRTAAFPAMVPPMTLLIGFITLGEVPTLLQLLGLGVVALGFRAVVSR
ncbi:EamA-like transporter family protein [Variibacter gotjawalensis]|uniref:EamA-like transporter family protein n=1 Tax=Variibacter gotjawalensis TaxID=1333996 RepID=A0A0S3PP11_9BRAD|nr:DMT family transporter [Variibacter gotjawalensis]NIK47962.1 drug/metabolite transporter (DMT)-like permease [Variibacter gotjawalensis]RZS49839.1 EamA-like transporter family protein [Variibacter gotjawalensis]BAT57668.1 EamA-like transporter family protein [Variibacter gotjawalensis]